MYFEIVIFSCNVTIVQALYCKHWETIRFYNISDYLRLFIRAFPNNNKVKTSQRQRVISKLFHTEMLCV